MQKSSILRKCLAVGIILLFIGTVIIPSSGQKIEKSSQSKLGGKWWYVGGSGPGNYSTIPAAMENASNGDTIFVYPGIYGHLKIRKSLHFIGFDKFTTILNGTGRYDEVSIEANDVTLSGFTVQNGGTPGTGDYGRGLSIQQRTNISISNVILRHNYLGIILYWDRNVVLDNISFVSNGGGIDFWDGKNCTISYCIFDHAGVSHNGFPPGDPGCSLFIRNNIFTNNSGIGLGFCIDSYGNTTIESNLFQNNACAISIYLSKGVNIWKNNFINNIKNVALSQESLIRQLSIYIKYRQHWMNNYWDDWNHKGSYPIPGIMTLDIGIPFIFQFHFVLIPVPILKIHYKEYDSAPAKEPYDIP